MTGPGIDGWRPSLDAPGGLHHSHESPRPTVSRIIRSAQLYDKSLLPRGSLDGKGAPLPSAARTLHGKAGVDLLPVMQEILALARVRSESIAMQDVVRVSSYYVEQWGGASPKAPASTP